MIIKYKWLCGPRINYYLQLWVYDAEYGCAQKSLMSYVYIESGLISRRMRRDSKRYGVKEFGNSVIMSLLVYLIYISNWKWININYFNCNYIYFLNHYNTTLLLKFLFNYTQKLYAQFSKIHKSCKYLVIVINIM